MLLMSVTLEVSQPPMSWLKAWHRNMLRHVRDARGVPATNVLVEGIGMQNMPLMSVTLEVSHATNILVEGIGSANMLLMSVTLEVSQPPMSWLKASALQNMLLMSVTLEVSHHQCPG